MAATVISEIHSQGTTLGYSETGAAPFTDLATLVSVTPAGLKRATTDRTQLTSTAKRKMRGLKDPQQVKFTAKWTSATWVALVALYNKAITAGLETYKLTIPKSSDQTTNPYETFDGFISELSRSEHVNEDGAKIVMIDGTIEVDGDTYAFVAAT